MKEIAAQAGLNPSHLSMIRSGKRGISKEAAQKLATALSPGDEATASDMLKKLIEAAGGIRTGDFPVVVATMPIQLRVPANSVGLFGVLESKIQTKEILTKQALIDFERQWDRNGEICIYAEEGKALEIYDTAFLTLTSENITEREITYYFEFGDPAEAELMAQKLSLPTLDIGRLHIYKRKSKRDRKHELHDPFEVRRISIIYTARGKNPVAYEKILDDPLLFHRVGGPLASKLLAQFIENKNNQSTWKKQKVKPVIGLKI